MAYGMINSMDVKIDKSGRIVVPKPLPDRLGLKSDMAHPTMVHVDELWVHQGTAPANAEWARVLEDVRDERLRTVGSD